MDIRIRTYQDCLNEIQEEPLVGLLGTIYHDTVRSIDPSIYSEDEKRAWAPGRPSVSHWLLRFRKAPPYIAWLNNADPATALPSEEEKQGPPDHVSMDYRASVVGFMNLEEDGNIDLAYVRKEYQRKGISSLLYHQIESEARQRRLLRLQVDASYLARPFFEKHGFKTLRKNRILRNGVSLVNFTLEKNL